MTVEHKILHLVDRGLVNRKDLTALVGPKANREGLRMHDAGLLQFAKPPWLTLTKLGVERLNELDGQS